MLSPRVRAALWLADKAERLPTSSVVRRAALALAAVLIACALLVVAPGRVEAQPDHELAARVCWSEAGARAHDECRAIVHVLVERAARLDLTFAEMARAYASRATGAEPGHRRPFIPLLTLDHVRPPPSWPHHGMRWSEGRTLFSALAVTAWRALRGIDATPCPGGLHWGAPGCAPCRRRMRVAGLVRLRCRVETANDFWGEG